MRSHFCSRRPLTPVVLGVALTLAASAASAQTYPLTGTQTGGNGEPASGPGVLYGSQYTLVGGIASSAVYAYNFDYLVSGATFTGGTGGTATGGSGTMPDGSIASADAVYGGPGGAGLWAYSYANVTINSGTFVGGAGGLAQGTSTIVNGGGDGGEGLYVNTAHVTINGGTFVGGASGNVAGDSPQFYGSQAGTGLDANNGAVVTINGGTFIGGNGSSVTRTGGNAYDGAPSPALELLGGTVSIYGGSFTGGGYDPVAPHGIRSAFAGYGIAGIDGIATLYGSSFTVNGVPNFFGSLPKGTGTVTAQLANNAAPTTFTYYLPQYYTGQIVLAAAPEPSALSALGLGSLALGTFALRARRRTA